MSSFLYNLVLTIVYKNGKVPALTDVIVLDMNYLKEANDRYGHDVGNKLIRAAAQTISDVFKRSPVFRIGGDEFLIILQNRDLAERNDLLAKLDAEFLLLLIVPA